MPILHRDRENPSAVQAPQTLQQQQEAFDDDEVRRRPRSIALLLLCCCSVLLRPFVKVVVRDVLCLCCAVLCYLRV